MRILNILTVRSIYIFFYKAINSDDLINVLCRQLPAAARGPTGGRHGGAGRQAEAHDAAAGAGHAPHAHHAHRPRRERRLVMAGC